MKKIIWIKIQVQIWHHVRPKRLMWPQIWVLGNFMTCWHFTSLWLCRRFSLTFHWNFDHNLHRLILTYIENVHGLNTKKLSLLLWYMTENYWAKAVAWFFNFESAKKLSLNHMPAWENVSWKLIYTSSPCSLTLIDFSKKFALCVSCKSTQMPAHIIDDNILLEHESLSWNVLS